MKILSMRRKAAVLLGGGTLILAACGSSSSSSSSSSAQAGCPSGQVEVSNGTGSSASVSCAVATKGGTMTIGTPQEPSSFLADGITDSMTFSYAVDAPISEGLLWYRSTEETSNAKTQADFYQPWLATKVPTTANGLVKTSGCANSAAKLCVTYPLQSGVLWQDGATFTAHDVCDTVNFFWLKYKDKNPTAILSTSGWDQIIKCTEDSPTQVTIDFSTQFGPYLSILTGVGGVLPAKQLEAAFATNGDLEKTPQTVDLTVGSGNPNAFKGTDTLDNIIVGTGPYVLQAYNKTKDIKLVPNKKYWNKAHQPNLDVVDFKIEADTPTQLAEAKAGSIDFGMDYRLRFLKDLQTAAAGGKLAVETIPDSGAEKIDLNLCSQTGTAGKCGATNTGNPALADPKLRKALLEGINRQQIVDTIAAKATVVPADSWLYLGAEYAKSPEVTVTAYDVAKAKSDLDAAGYKLAASCHGGAGRADLTGKCLDLHFVTTSGNQARADAQVAIQQDLQAIGIFIAGNQLETVKAGTLFGPFSGGGVLYNHKFDMAMYTNTMSSPAEPDSYFPGYTCGQIPSAANSGQGQNDTGICDPALDAAFNKARQSVDLSVRTAAYQDAAKILAAALPELPLYQQVTVNSYSTKLKGLKRNDLVWTYNLYDWFCTGGVCQA
jgi:peptide/nickel transport system substrate-binding protein